MNDNDESKQIQEYLKIQAEIAKIRAFMASEVGQLMKANPKMTLEQAMKRLGYWKEN